VSKPVSKKKAAPKKRIDMSSPPAVVVRRSSAGLGLFAGEAIKKGSFVIEYTGVKLTEAEYRACNSRYLFDIGPKGALDGSPRWNTARYINHSCAPNCDPDVRRGRVYIMAIRDIEPGDELSYDYGKEYWEEMIGANCRCVKCQGKDVAKKAKAA
jgi:SET domain-containing protein